MVGRLRMQRRARLVAGCLWLAGACSSGGVTGDVVLADGGSGGDAVGDLGDGSSSDADVTDDAQAIADGGADASPVDAAPSADTGAAFDAAADGGTTPDGDTSADADTPPDTDTPPDGDAISGPDAEADAGVTPDVVAPPPVIWDTALITDASTAACTWTGKQTVLKEGKQIDVWKLSYVSYESVGGVLQPITIKAFAAKPAGQGGPMPGVVQAHGLGGHAKPSHATGLAALLDTYVIAFTGPGGGDGPDNTSEGLGSSANDGMRLFDTVPDPRGTWIWGHAMAAMRAVTCLEAAPEVDASRLGMTGYSAGGVVSWLSAGADARLKAAVPLSGNLAWEEAVKSTDAWQHALLTAAQLTTASVEWQTLIGELVTPQVALGLANTPVFMVNGTSDEFFPLTSTVATIGALPTAHHLSLAANYDHGCYVLNDTLKDTLGIPLEATGKIEARASERAKGAQRAFFHHHFGTDPLYAALPAPPKLSVQSAAGVAIFAAEVDPGPGGLSVDEVSMWWSGDDAFTFLEIPLKPKGGPLYASDPVPAPAPGSIYYADVLYTDGGFGPFAERFSVSSNPVIPAGHVPKIRGIDDCGLSFLFGTP